MLASVLWSIGNYFELLLNLGYKSHSRNPLPFVFTCHIHDVLNENAEICVSFVYVQARFSPIDFDYLGYYFMRFEEYKKRKEEIFILTSNFLKK